jgi:hypothetical protein
MASESMAALPLMVAVTSFVAVMPRLAAMAASIGALAGMEGMWGK